MKLGLINSAWAQAGKGTAYGMGGKKGASDGVSPHATDD